MRWSQRKVWWLASVFIVIILLLAILWVVAVSKARNYTTTKKELSECRTNLTERELAYNKAVDIKDSAIATLTKNQSELNQRIEKLKSDLSECQKSLLNVENLQKEKDKKIEELQNELNACRKNINTTEAAKNQLASCLTELSKEREKEKGVAKTFPKYFGLNPSVYVVQVIQITFFFAFILMLSIPLSFDVSIRNRRIALSWIWASIFTAIIAGILEYFKPIQQLPFWWHVTISAVVFILIYCLFYFGIIREE